MLVFLQTSGVLEPIPRIPSDKVMLLLDLKILVLYFDSTPKVTFPKALITRAPPTHGSTCTHGSDSGRVLQLQRLPVPYILPSLPDLTDWNSHTPVQGQEDSEGTRRYPGRLRKDISFTCSESYAQLPTYFQYFSLLQARLGEAENKEHWSCAFPVQWLCQDPQGLKNNLP